MNLRKKKSIKNLILYFQVHQPRRLNSFSFFDIGTGKSYFDDDANSKIIQRISEDCYLPANTMLLRLIKKYPQTRITFSITGLALEQLEHYAPKTLKSFQKLAATGCVEFLGETYFHSLSSISNSKEFRVQVEMHARKMKELLGVTASVFRNTELIYANRLGHLISGFGYHGMLLDGIDTIAQQQSVHQLYHHPSHKHLKLLLRDYHLSDDVAFRYSDKNWTEWPLSSSTFYQWLTRIPHDQNVVLMGMDYETFGEHQKSESGIFKFLSDLIKRIDTGNACRLVTPSEAIERLPKTKRLSVPRLISWADKERNLSPWLGNDMQQDAYESLAKIGKQIRQLNDNKLLRTWRYLQTSDHFYYMSTKQGDDGNVHSYFSPYPSPYEAFMNYMNVLADLSAEVKIKKSMRKKKVTLEKLHPVPHSILCPSEN